MTGFFRRFRSDSDNAESDYQDEDLASGEDASGFTTSKTTLSADLRHTDNVPTLAEKFFKWAGGLLNLALAIAIALLLAFFIFQFGRDIGFNEGEQSVDTPPNYIAKIDWNRLPKWTDAANPIFLKETSKNAEKFKGNAFDQFALGMHERDNGSIEKAYYYLTLSAARGHPYARAIRDQLAISPVEKTDAIERFKLALKNGGDDGNFRLGMLFLGDDAFTLATHPNTRYCDNGRKRETPTWPPCEENFALAGADTLPWPNDLLQVVYEKAYLGFARAAQCFHPDAPLWLSEMENRKWVDQTTAQNLRNQARTDVQSGGNSDAFCRGGITVGSAGGGGAPGGSSVGAGQAALSYCSLNASDGVSKAQRDRPGRSRRNAADDAAEAPLSSADATLALQAADEARICLRMGDAMLAAGDVDSALQYFRASIARGRKFGAQASVIAGDRLRALSLTCEYTTDSLARISRGVRGYDFIDIIDRQRALKALGYYRARVDGKWGEQTREAVRNFQREIAFDETGILTPMETVILVCQAAETKSDIDAQNILGIMYMTGLGVVQNTDLAIQWLETAGRRGNADAYYNLAIVFSTGTILSSYRLCDRRFNDEVAKAYFLDAQRLGHREALLESFDQFKDRIVKENGMRGNPPANTGLEIVTPSCGERQLGTGLGQNK